jgi:hypothetical protein
LSTRVTLTSALRAAFASSTIRPGTSFMKVWLLPTNRISYGTIRGGCSPRARCRFQFSRSVRSAARRAACTAGTRRPKSRPMIAITTSSSTSVIPERRSGLPQTHETSNRTHTPRGE